MSVPLHHARGAPSASLLDDVGADATSRDANVCRRSWNRKSASPAAFTAGCQYRLKFVPRLRPSGVQNTSVETTERRIGRPPLAHHCSVVDTVHSAGSGSSMPSGVMVALLEHREIEAVGARSILCRPIAPVVGGTPLYFLVPSVGDEVTGRDRYARKYVPRSELRRVQRWILRARAETDSARPGTSRIPASPYGRRRSGSENQPLNRAHITAAW